MAQLKPQLKQGNMAWIRERAEQFERMLAAANPHERPALTPFESWMFVRMLELQAMIYAAVNSGNDTKTTNE